MDNRPVSSNLRSENKRLRIRICPGSSGLASTASPTMNVLRNFDLLELIFSYFAIPNTRYCDFGKRRRRLLRAGLICKAFFEPAMNLLWYQMESFLPLLLVIPVVTEREGIYTSTSSVREADLSRFEFYASRIRLLSLSSFREKISTHIYMAIAEVFQGKTLFPALTNVHILCLDKISNENFLWLHLITPSPLSAVEVCNVSKFNDIRLNSFIHDMSRLHRPSSINSHPLSALSLKGDFLPSTANLLWNFTRLTKLTFKLISTATNILKDILKFSSSSLILLELKLELPEYASENLRTNLSQESKLYTFPTLQTLFVAGPAPDVCDILESIYGVWLSRITIFIFLPVTDTQPEIPKCIQRCISMTPTLLHLHICLPDDIIRMGDDMFTPFQSFRLLRSLRIDNLMHNWAVFMDSFDKEFGQWPVLETATFTHKYEGLEQDRTSFDIHGPLIPLHLPAITCPKLCKLETYLPHPFEYKAITDSMQDLLESSERTDHILAELTITFLEPKQFESPSMDTIMKAKEAILLARVIDHLYPNLKHFNIYDIVTDVMGSIWRPWYHGVVMMVKNFQEARGR